MPAKTKLAQVIACEEGFGIVGTIPTIRHNPMDLRHSPHSQHPNDPNEIGWIDNDDDGWADAERQLRIYANEEPGFITYPPNGYNLAQMVNVICGLPANAPSGSKAPDNNNAENYLIAVTLGMKMPPHTLVSVALEVPAV